MTQRPLTLIRLAAEYGLKTLDADIAAKKLGLNLRRGAAIVRPWQEELLRPELAKMAGEDYIRRIRMAKYIESYRRGYEDEYENDNARLGWLSPLAWWGFGSRGAGLGEGAGAVSLPVLGWAIA